ncbi:PadR family transcriptional regulator [Alicyclobacillus fastidiosus]|uniref:PadR family transcriptional regulator n=1 Tax=Alicyclobacillus fastidiosus TaxID=392011 RepID=A0ABV5AI76_9BACL|nr:PadR family transcriptional regulator [Alicyclobacillus fastidiosus]WEH10111.1 PadR family transcriptional regulator [Alicyclobacillus fastidiosus]
MYAEILILGQLLSGPKHGYEIKKNIQKDLGEEFEINNNLLYPALRRFLEMGAISKEVVKSDGKPERHVYLMTDVGEEIFNDMIRDFPGKLAASQMEFLVRVALFDRLEPDMRQEILHKRQEVLEERLHFFRHIENTHSESPFVIEVIRFQRSQVEHELAWIVNLEHA